jgi:integrase
VYIPFFICRGPATLTRTVTHSNLSTPSSRARLKPSPKLYWHSVDCGVHLGYRKGLTGSKWVKRIYLGEQKYRLKIIAIADDHVAADGVRVMSFAQAKRKVLADAAGPLVSPYSVAQAMASYFKRREQMGGNVALDARRCEMHILPMLGATPVDALTKPGLEEWLASLVRGKTAKKIRASRVSANRVLVILKAALNMAHKADLCASNKAWSAVEPFKDVNQPRLRFFSRGEVADILKVVGQSDFGLLCHAALFTGCRYGELMRLRVSDFEPDTGTVWVAESKSGKPRRIVLAPEGRRFFEALVDGRSPDSFLLTRDGRQWREHEQSGPMAKGTADAMVESGSFHTWRKTAASHWLMSGVHLSVVSQNLGHADSKLTESTYSHLAPSFKSDEMKKAADFGTTEPSIIVPLTIARK